MTDGVIAGLLGGLFGPAIAQWMSKFKYWFIFVISVLSVQGLLIIHMVRVLGFEKTIESFSNGVDPVFFFVPFGIGILAMLIALLGSANALRKTTARGNHDDQA